MGASGKLFIVGTPIGNLGDFSPRALETLQQADRVAAEDTRVTARLLNYFGIAAATTSFHEHNTRERLPFLMAELRSGKKIALVSDAGMPCISDPGAALVAACRREGIAVETVPGPSAVVTALAASGFEGKHFYFAGFLSADKKKRSRELSQLLEMKEVLLILYESPHRLRRTLTDLDRAGFASRPLCLAREMTKLHEEFTNLTVRAAIDKYKKQEPRGEYVLILDLYSKAAEASGGANLTDATEPVLAGPPGVVTGPVDRTIANTYLEGRDRSSLTLSEAALGALVSAELLAGRQVKAVVKNLLRRPDLPSGLSKNRLYEKIQDIKDFLTTEHLIEGAERKSEEK